MTKNAKRVLLKIAGILSGVLSPLLIPTYCTAIAMWLSTINRLPEEPRFLATLAVFGMTCALPLLILLGLLRLGLITNLDITDRRQRFGALLKVLVCYVLTAVYMAMVSAPWWLVMFFVGGCLLSLIVGFVSTFWKISVHATGMGTMAGMILAMMVGGHTDYNLLGVFCFVILLGGVLGSARLLLRRHTVWQVLAGWALGILVTLWAMTSTLGQHIFSK